MADDMITRTSPQAGGLQAGAEPLFYARSVLADLAHFDDETIHLACAFLIGHADTDEAEKHRARRTRQMFLGKPSA
ncbi:hypothetical protein [Puniceibacterium confluentis]|uniref:hypothetical protein n=1 Tax=Puniceibacterium confluentis TaxID=1958944 RepID=UPI0011B73637|nr:hypothetical protein [Puniceibacterium confluentis]